MKPVGCSVWRRYVVVRSTAPRQGHRPHEPFTGSWQYVPELVRRDSEPLVHKAYGDSFEDTDLESVLAERGIGRLIVAGAQTDECIRSTLHGAITRGYDATLVAPVADGLPDSSCPAILVMRIDPSNMGIREPGPIFGLTWEFCRADSGRAAERTWPHTCHNVHPRSTPRISWRPRP